MNNNNKQPKILLLDIESSPIKGFTWEVYDTRVLKILEPSKIICGSWKWLGEKTTHVKCLADYKGYKPGKLDDSFLVAELWSLLDEADIVVAHNGASFDVKKLNARFIYYNLMMPSSYDVIDTLKVAKKYFKFDQNSLDSLGEYLDEGRKLSTGGFDLWDKCMNGDMKSWQLMRSYNVQDTELLERIYIRFRPYMEHPNLNLITDKLTDITCPSCLSTRVQKRGFSYTKAGRKQRFQCSDCGAWSSGPWSAVKTALS